MELNENRTSDAGCSDNNLLANTLKLSLGIASIMVKNLLSIIDETSDFTKKNPSLELSSNCMCEFPEVDPKIGRYHKWHDHFYCSNIKR